METVSQRELRNRSGELLRRASAGERIRITTNGVPVAELVPPNLTAVERLRTQGRLSPATVRGADLDDLPPPMQVAEPLSRLLTEVRGDR
ncbi:type II toxin-antitoxin system Phd/YefM family antitoxin [Blastococcus capsensis]|uniref:type II toxin-antitoxin system Phd/YefM family antitoxin n=1 Tax=Blastococcus capsensis TaxID=1564163 RepID=UPI0025414234|nr:type II toxin-antitoxin system prevent-host-death family antitoxin [Blastococcus capsensis]MDK3256663.1 type II toxin-antitoxin system prevent-host-death family antitoxin [Blastococcus capsensis]